MPGDEGDHAPADIEKSYLEELNDFVEAAFLKKMADLQDLEALKLRPKQKEADDADAAQVQKEKEKDEKAFTDILETGQHDSTEAKAEMKKARVALLTNILGATSVLIFGLKSESEQSESLSEVRIYVGNELI